MRFFFIVLTFLAVGCDRANPVGPDGNHDVPDQSIYEPIPAFHRLVEENGNETRMWARLNTLQPLRGSTVLLNRSCNTARPDSLDCYRLEVEVGFDDFDNPYVVAQFEIGLSMDGVSINRPLRMPNIQPNRSELVGIYDFPFEMAYKYLVVRASHPSGGTGAQFRDPAETGATKFFLDYR